MTTERVENVIIVGSGPAGYTAALYTARANLEPLVIEGFAWGGLLQQTTEVENYPGFPEGIMGPEMMQRFRDQAERFGARLITDEAHPRRAGHASRAACTGSGSATTSTGPAPSSSRWAPSTRSSACPARRSSPARGVSYCATCDAAFFRDREILVVGGGDSAMEEAIFLAKFGSKVSVVHRRDEFRASKIMLERARAQDNLELLTPYVVEELLAGERPVRARRAPAERRDGRDRARCPSAARSSRSATSRSRRSSPARSPSTTSGYVVTEGRSTRTALPGVFAAGDLVDHTYRQAITAAGSGCQAALDAEWYLRDTPEVQTPAGMPEGDLAEAAWAHHDPAPAPASAEHGG